MCAAAQGLAEGRAVKGSTRCDGLSGQPVNKMFGRCALSKKRDEIFKWEWHEVKGECRS